MELGVLEIDLSGFSLEVLCPSIGKIVQVKKEGEGDFEMFVCAKKSCFFYREICECPPGILLPGMVCRFPDGHMDAITNVDKNGVCQLARKFGCKATKCFGNPRFFGRIKKGFVICPLDAEKTFTTNGICDEITCIMRECKYNIVSQGI